MKHILIFILLCFSGSLWAQYPAGANKLVLGRQTTGDGLIFRGTGSPAFTPTSNANAWFFLDTAAQVLYTHIGGTWVSLADTITSGGTVTLSGEVVGASNATKLDTVDRVIFDPTNGGADSTYKLTYNANDFTLHFGMGIGSQIYQMGQELYYPPCINKTASTIYAGQPVMIDTSGIIQGDRLAVMPAFADGLPANYIVGVAAHDIAPNAEGLVTWFGYVPEVDHADVAASGFTLDVGDILYLSATPGKYRDTEPTPPAVNSTIAIVVRKPNANNMTLLVRPWLNEKLGELTDVDLTGLTNGQVLAWDSINKVWEPVSKQDPLNGTGLVKSTGGTISYITDNSANWNAAYNDKINSAAFTGTDTKTLTLTQQDAGTVTASFTDLQGVTSVATGVGLSGGTITTTGTISADTTVLVSKTFLTNQGYTSNVGTVTSVATGVGLTGGTITSSGTISADTTVLASKTWTQAQGYLTSEVDGSVTNEGSLTVGAGSGTTSVINSNTSGSTGVTIAASTGLSISESGSTITLTNSAPDQTVSLTGAGITSISGTYPSFTITSTEVDGSTSNELQNLTLSGQSLGITSGSGVTLPVVGISAGTGIGVTSSSGTFTITNNSPDQTVSVLSGTGITVSGSYPNFTVTNASPDQTVSITGAGINSVTGTYPNFTVTGTEVDGSVSNEGTLGVGAGSGTTAVITSNTSGATGVTISAGTGIGISETTSSNGGTITVTNNSPDQTVSLTGAGINSVTGTYPNFTITATEVDGSTTNELQTLSASSNQITLSNSGGSVTIAGAGINTVGTVGSTITVTGTEVDGSTTNEGTLGVGAGGANTAVINSNTSGATGVTIAGGTNVTITESTSSNGGTITVNASGGDSGWFKFLNNYVTPTESKPMKFSGSDSLYIFANSFSDTNYLAMSTAYLSDSIDVSAKRYDLLLDIDMSLVSSVARLADSTAALRAAFPTTIYSGNGTLSAARTISTNGNKLTISGSNTAQVLEIDNTNTGTTTNALTLQSFGPPLQATRLTSSTGSILPVSDYYVNTSSTAAVGLGGFQRFYIEDAGGLNKEAGRIGFRTSDATGSSYDSEAFISVRKDSSELKEGFTLLSTGQLHLKEYGDTLFTGTAVKYLAVDNDGKVIETDAGRNFGTVAANKVAFGAATGDTLTSNTNLHWDNTNGRLGINNTSPSERLQVGGNVRAERVIVNTSGQSSPISNFRPTNAIGENFYIGGGGESSTAHPDTTFQGSFNLGVGLNSLLVNTTGFSNTAIGGYALYLNTRGNANTAIGGSALLSNTIGNENLAIANNALYSNTSGSQNVGIGTYSLFNNTTGAYNMALGTYGLYNNTTGSTNISIGAFALYSNTSAIKNIGIGQGALFYLTTGSNNTAIGADAGVLTNAGANNTSLSNSTLIGQDTRPSASGNTNEVVIGYEGRGNGSNTTTLGNTSTTGTFLAAGNLNLTGQAAMLVQTARHTTANTAGNSLTLKVGGATSGATDKAGGDLILESGVSTGNASSNIIFETAAAGAAGTTDRTPAEVARINGAGKLGLGTTSPNGRLEIVEINPLTTTQLEVLTITSNTSTTPSSGLGSKIIFRGETTTTESSPQSEIVSLWQTATHASRRSRIAFRTIENGGEMSNRVVINGDKVGVGLNHNSPTNTLDVQGSFGRGAPVTVTDSLYGVPLTTNWIIANRSGQIQLVLPTASDFTGRELMVKTITANTVISANSDVVPLIGGTAGTAILPATDGAWATLVSDGSNWIIMQSGQ